ncbi:MAG: phosphate signaling complex PhoU family protein [Ktedonobacterales bacterium]
MDRIEDAIGSLGDETTELGIFAEEVFKNAAAALYEQPEAAARIALDTERVCQQVYHMIHQKGLAVLAWYQPTVDDMRRVVELQHIAAELVRIGTDGRRIAEQAQSLHGSAEAVLRATNGPAALLLANLIRQTYRLVRGCVIVTTTRDTVMAKRLIAEDPELDRLYLSYKAALDEAIRANPRGASTLQRLLLAGVHMEDMGNRVVAICRGLLFEPPQVSP